MSHKKSTRLALICSVALVILLAVCAAILGAGSKENESLSLPKSTEVKSVTMNRSNDGYALGERYFDLEERIATIFAQLDGARKISRQSVNDIPVNTDYDNYLEIAMTLADETIMRRLYLYSVDGKYFIEEPYVGIYQTTREASAEIYKIYNDGADTTAKPITPPAAPSSTASDMVIIRYIELLLTKWNGSTPPPEMMKSF